MKVYCAFPVGVCLLLVALSSYSSMPVGAESHYAPEIFRRHSAPLMLSNNRIYTYVSLNGMDEKLFLIDNGCSQIFIDQALAEEGNFIPYSEIDFKAIHKKQITAEVGLVDMMKIGDLEIDHPRVRVSDFLKFLSRKDRRRVYGVIAAELMQPYLTTIDFRAKMLYFEPHNPESLAGITEDENIISFEFGPNTLSQGSEQLFSIPIYINGNPVNAMVDLGFSGGILTTLESNRIGLIKSMRGNSAEVAIGGYSGRGFRWKAKEVRIGGQVIKNVKLIRFSAPDVPEFTVVGVDFLKQFKLTFDYQNRMVYLVPIA